jgi:hypothetical protein
MSMTISTSAPVSTTSAAFTAPVETRKAETGLAGAPSTLTSLANPTAATQVKQGFFSQISSKVASVVNGFCKWIENGISWITSFFKKSPATPATAAPTTPATAVTGSLLETEKSLNNLNVYLRALKSSFSDVTLRTAFNWMLTDAERDELYHEIYVQDGSKSEDPDFGLHYVEANPKGDLLIKATEALIAKKQQALGMTATV